MRNDLLLPRNTILPCILAVCLLATAFVPLAAANEVLKWNETALKAVAADGQNPIQGTRTIAEVQGAVHDALNAINRRYAAYYFEESGASGASLMPPWPLLLTRSWSACCRASAPRPRRSPRPPSSRTLTWPPQGRVSDASAKMSGVAVGRAAGAAMLALRKDDGALRDAPYTRDWPRQWRPSTPTANPPIANELARGYASSMLPGLSNVTPFTLLSAAQFWLPGPPALTSEAYAKDYNEIKSLGGQVSTARTADQTGVARFWFQGPSAWYLIARTVAGTRALDAWDSARAPEPHVSSDGGRLHRRL